MPNYCCDQCGQEFSQKSRHDAHKKRKTPCANKAVEEPPKEKEQLNEIKDKNKENKLQKPFLKWVGGKTQMIDTIMDKFPSEMENYHELFLGGGSVLFALLSLQKQGKIVVKRKIYAYDLNETLIHVYKNVQTNKDALFTHITTHVNAYDAIQGLDSNVVNRKAATLKEATTSKESYYYWIRKQFNAIADKSTVECSALFMFLNKMCFRGVYREGPNGFNVPYGHPKSTPTVITKAELDYISDLIQDVVFLQSDFNRSIRGVNVGDFVYLDPPYAPETENSFVGYTSEGFNLAAHQQLFGEIQKIKNKNIQFVMSNAKVKLVMDAFGDSCKCDEVVARRAINSKNPGATTTEIIVYN
jgi:DNA adenine methylase